MFTDSVEPHLQFISSSFYKIFLKTTCKKQIKAYVMRQEEISEHCDVDFESQVVVDQHVSRGRLGQRVKEVKPSMNAVMTLPELASGLSKAATEGVGEYGGQYGRYAWNDDRGGRRLKGG